MNAKPHHILIILAIGLAFEGLVITAASDFTLGTPFVNGYAAAILLACGIVSAFGERSRVAGLTGSLLGLALVAIIGLNTARLGYKWQGTWGWLSVPILHSFITVGACLAAFIGLWRCWPSNSEERPMLPALRLAVALLGGVAMTTVMIIVKGSLPPQEASGNSKATPRELLVAAPPDLDSPDLPDLDSADVPDLPDPGPVYRPPPIKENAPIDLEVGPIVTFAAALLSSDEHLPINTPTAGPAFQTHLEPRPVMPSAMETAASAFFTTHGPAAAREMLAAHGLPPGIALADAMQLYRANPTARASDWLPSHIIESQAWILPGAPGHPIRAAANGRINERVAASKIIPFEQGETRSTRSDRRERE